jgi:hypothetical protein
MNALFSPDPLLYPSLGAPVLDFVRAAYGLLVIATLVAALPHARRYFLSERWGGYAERGRWTDRIQHPVVLPIVVAAWLVAGLALLLGRVVVPAAIVNVLLCRYFFVQMRWRGVLRGMGAPGFMTYWLSVAVLLLETTRRFAPGVHGLALLVLQADFAFIMLSAGVYKFSSGYRQNDGMELGMVNPEWGYWNQFWSRRPRGSRWFRLFNELAWGTEVIAGVLMLIPATRFLGSVLIFVSFIFIASQIRLGFLCEMVILCCLLFAHSGSLIDLSLAGWMAPSTAVAVTPPLPFVTGVLGAALWSYLGILPFARAGLAYNLYARKVLPGVVQRALDWYVNLCGLIVWRVFSVDLVNFYVQIHEQSPTGTRHLVSEWGRSLRYRQVAESIAVTSIFTTLKYYPSRRDLFLARLVRYARTVPCAAGNTLVFQYISVSTRNDRFQFRPVAEYTVDPLSGDVKEKTLDPAISVHAPGAASPIHEATRPGTYAPLRP